MYIAGTTYHLKHSEAIKLAPRVRPDGGKCILRCDPLGMVALFHLSPKPLYSGQGEFVEHRSDRAA